MRGLMDSSGLSAHTDYSPYGERITYGPGHARTSLGYHGEMTDGNGMVYMRARTYDPRPQGRSLLRPPPATHPHLRTEHIRVQMLTPPPVPCATLSSSCPPSQAPCMHTRPHNRPFSAIYRRKRATLRQNPANRTGKVCNLRKSTQITL
ncbi:MAG: hypothetical protein AAGK74_18110 [Chloroflexota bacterium]